MSMSVEERRTEVLREQEWPAGKVRLVKASNKHDRRYRHLVVEWLPAAHYGELEEYQYQGLRDWWPINADNMVQATAFFAGASVMMMLSPAPPQDR